MQWSGADQLFQALVEHPPMGRRKQTMDHDPKPRGRNELIADYIQKLTGVERSRKQVSSHIQVMKPMVKDDPFSEWHIMLSTDSC